jgi:hypothetical protein
LSIAAQKQKKIKVFSYAMFTDFRSSFVSLEVPELRPTYFWLKATGR